VGADASRPVPYAQRRLLAVRPYLTSERLRAILEPAEGERLLEIGPGTGRDAVAVARALGAAGALAVLDVQQQMLDDVLARVREHGVENIAATRSDARRLPYPDAAFDGAYLISVLGEIPDQAAALRELARVLKPAGRLVVGEIMLDPHFVPFGALRARAEAAGLRFERRRSAAFAYFARFAKP
jgi:ubiquinone/menaquinone biosynthesis C-methylase UbiE